MLIGNHTFKLIRKQKNLVTAFCFELLGLDSEGKEYACNVGDLGSIPELGKSPGERNGNPLQYSCLENSIPWTEEAGRLQSMGSQRVGQD